MEKVVGFAWKMSSRVSSTFDASPTLQLSGGEGSCRVSPEIMKQPFHFIDQLQCQFPSINQLRFVITTSISDLGFGFAH